MASITRYCYTADAQDQVRDYVQFNLDALAPFDALKVLVEQYIYLDMLRLGGTSPTTEDFRRSVGEMCSLLPFKIYTPNPNLNELYARGVRFVFSQLQHPNNPATQITWAELFAIFSQPNEMTYRNGEYTCTMNELLLREWWGVMTNHDEGCISGPAPVYAPSIEVFLNRDPHTTRLENTNYEQRIKFAPIAVGKKFSPSSGDGLFWDYIQSFDLSAYKIDDLIPLLSAFCIDHFKYVMTNSGITDITVSVPDICFDLVTGSDYTARSAGLNDTVLDGFLEIVKHMITMNHLQPLTDYSLFGELLAHCHADPKLVNYFIQPINAISAAEAYAFRTSVYADLIPDRFEMQAGMEAIGEDPDTETITTDDDLGDSGLGEDPGTDDTVGDLDSEGNADSAAARPKPLIDPNQMLLELARTDENLSDYLYKEMVARRISALLRNPPENALPNDLLMLRRWRSRWLFLVSVACIRDFLTRISLRLSDN